MTLVIDLESNFFVPLLYLPFHKFSFVIVNKACTSASNSLHITELRKQRQEVRASKMLHVIAENVDWVVFT